MRRFYLELVPLIPDICWNGFLQVVTCTAGFIHVIQKSDHMMMNVMIVDEWISAIGEVASQFVCKFVEFHTI